MSDIQRYNIDQAAERWQFDKGHWCKYSDVEPLEERITKLEEFIDELARDNDLSPLSDWRDGF